MTLKIPRFVAGWCLVLALLPAPAQGGPPAGTPIAPADGATQVAVPTLLEVSLSDPDNDALSVTFFGRRTTPATPGPDFTIATLPDTQYYSSSLNGGTPAHFHSQTQWIVDNRDALNIAFVSHMGDCVQNGDQFESEWIVADSAMDAIEDHAATLRSYGIPWGMAPGNHDQSPGGSASGTTTFYNQYFGSTRFGGRTYYGGHYGSNNDNNCQLFSASGLDFIVIHFEYDTAPDQPVLDWADALLKAHPERRGIITSHYIMEVGTQAAFGAQGQAIYDNLKDNPNLFLLLCGHRHGEGRRVDVFDDRTIQTVLQDYQGSSNGGDGWLRYFVFSPTGNEIRAFTYSTTLQQFESDADSQFTLLYDMQAPITGFAELGVVAVPPGGPGATFAWAGLAADRDYEWFAAVTDGNSAPVATATRRFTTLPNSVPTVTLTSPPDATATVAHTIKLTADADDMDNGVTRVEFFQGNVKIGEATGAPFQFVWENVAPGDYELTAVAVDDSNAAALSNVAHLSVIDASAPLTLIAENSTWKYLDDGSNQGTAWREKAFDDSGWASGPAELGYGDGGEATVVSYGPNANNKYTCTYFRRAVAVADPNRVIGLALQLKRDDGAVVYFNGVEIARSNMPSGAITHTTPASSAVSGSNESAFFSIPLASTAIDALDPGPNVIAVEIHQSSATSSDISFDLELIADVLPVADTDEDGMPDAYEIPNDLNPYSDADATGDKDGDGVINRDEFVFGLQINAPDHYSAAVTLAPANDTVTISFATLPGRTYRVHWCNDLSSWNPVPTQVTGDGTVHEWIDDGTVTGSTPASALKRVYRVEVTVDP